MGTSERDLNIKQAVAFYDDGREFLGISGSVCLRVNLGFAAILRSTFWSFFVQNR